jgi:hypothetical protein
MNLIPRCFVLEFRGGSRLDIRADESEKVSVASNTIRVGQAIRLRNPKREEINLWPLQAPFTPLRLP